MTKRMRLSITGMLNEVDETLHKMAQNRCGDMDESACYEAVRELRIKRTEIKLRFERRFINLFENGIRTSREHGKHEHTHSETNRGSLLNNNPAIENSVGAVRKSCGQALLDLDRKIGLLLDTAEVTNPMQPEIVFEAFREACRDIKSGDEVRLMMFRIFERRIADELQDIYQDINKLLEAQTRTTGSTAASGKETAASAHPQAQTVMARYEVTARIEKRLVGREVPDFVRSFLLKHWRVYLETIYNTYTENSIAWNAARQTMDDLLWNVSEITTLYDRQRKVQQLPSLLFRLINGMKVIAMDEADIEKFLKQLKTCQLKSLDYNNGQLLDTITEQARESVGRRPHKPQH